MNYLVTCKMPLYRSNEKKEKFSNQVRIASGMIPTFLNIYCPDQIFKKSVSNNKIENILSGSCWAYEGHFSAKKDYFKKSLLALNFQRCLYFLPGLWKVLESGLYLPKRREKKKTHNSFISTTVLENFYCWCINFTRPFEGYQYWSCTQ